MACHANTRAAPASCPALAPASCPVCSAPPQCSLSASARYFVSISPPLGNRTRRVSRSHARRQQHKGRTLELCFASMHLHGSAALRMANLERAPGPAAAHLETARKHSAWLGGGCMRGVCIPGRSHAVANRIQWRVREPARARNCFQAIERTHSPTNADTAVAANDRAMPPGDDIRCLLTEQWQPQPSGERRPGAHRPERNCSARWMSPVKAALLTWQLVIGTPPVPCRRVVARPQ